MRLEVAGAADEVVAAFPRRDFKHAFHEALLVKQAAQNPTAYLFTWLHETVRAHVVPLPTFDELFFGAPFAE